MNSKRIHEVKIQHFVDFDADTSYLEQEGFEDRLRQYKGGQFSYIGIRAQALYYIAGRSSSILQKITSVGLWGIESDSDDSYLEEIEKEELASLRSELIGIGFSRRAIAAAFRTVVKETI